MTFKLAGRYALEGFRRLTEHAVPDVAVPPVGVPVELAGRGTTYVVDLPGPTPDAPVLLLMHGIATTGPLTWFSVLGELAEHYRVVTFDQRWHGRGITAGTFTVADCADDGAAVLDALGIDRAVVVGYSMGGASAQVLWQRHPDRVAGLVLCSTAGRWQGHLGERVFFGALGALNLALAEIAAERVRARVEGVTEPDDRVGLRDWCLAELRTTSPWSFPVVMAELGRFDSREWIGDVNVPTGVLVTARDHAIPTSRQQELAALIPHAVVRESPGGHTSLVFDLANWRPIFLELVGQVVRLSAASEGRSA